MYNMSLLHLGYVVQCNKLMMEDKQGRMRDFKRKAGTVEHCFGDSVESTIPFGQEL